MGEESYGDKKEYVSFLTSNQGLLDIGAMLFIYESGMKIGLGRLIAQNDDLMIVDVSFTDQPRLVDETGRHFMTYGLISDAAGLGDGQ